MGEDWFNLQINTDLMANFQMLEAHLSYKYRSVMHQQLIQSVINAGTSTINARTSKIIKLGIRVFKK